MNIPTLPDSPYHYGILTWGYAKDPEFEQVRFVVPTPFMLRSGTPLNSLCFVPVPKGGDQAEKKLMLAKAISTIYGYSSEVEKSYALYDSATVDQYLKTRPQPGSQRAIQAEIERLERELKQG